MLSSFIRLFAWRRETELLWQFVVRCCSSAAQLPLSIDQDSSQERELSDKAPLFHWQFWGYRLHQCLLVVFPRNKITSLLGWFRVETEQRHRQEYVQPFWLSLPNPPHAYGAPRLFPPSHGRRVGSGPSTARSPSLRCGPSLPRSAGSSGRGSCLGCAGRRVSGRKSFLAVSHGWWYSAGTQLVGGGL